MKIVIPVAGTGTRLRPHTFSQPKALLSIAGKPVLGHILDRVSSLNASEITLVTGFLSEKIEKYAKDQYNGRISTVEQKTLLGIGYAVYLGIGETIDEDVLVVLGDTIVESELNEFISSDCNTLGVHPVDDPTEFGIAEVENNRVKEVIEKPKSSSSRLALVGVYLIKEPARYRECFEYIREKGIRTGGELQITDVISRMIETGSEFNAMEIEDWYDCGKPETLLETNRHLLSSAGGDLPPDMENCVTIPPVSLAHDSVYRKSVIGPHVTIGSGCSIENCLISDSVVLHGAVINNCILTASIVGRDTKLTGTERIVNVGDNSEIMI